eukprot:418946-Pleurochrysis_carterae.AAC.3
MGNTASRLQASHAATSRVRWRAAPHSRTGSSPQRLHTVARAAKEPAWIHLQTLRLRRRRGPGMRRQEHSRLIDYIDIICRDGSLQASSAGSPQHPTLKGQL